MSQTKVPLLDLRREADEVDPLLREAFQRVLESGRYIMGPEVTGLEAECAQALEVKHTAGVSSGTDALLVALMALGVGPGDEVILPTFTFFATAGTVARVGATPVFVDSLPCCFNLDPDDVARKITPQTRVIMPVHLFGQCARTREVIELAQKADHKIYVIEDAAQAFGVRDHDGFAGTQGDIGCFSFFPSKNFGGFGDGGLTCTNDDELAEKLRILRLHGGKPKYHHAVVGGNFRLDAIQAALLRVLLPRLPAKNDARAANAKRYDEAFTSMGLGKAAPACGQDLDEDLPLVLPRRCGPHHIFNQYVIRVRGEGKRDQLRSYLSEHDVGTEIYYPVPMHRQKCFADLGHKVGDLPVAEQLASEALAIPVFPGLREDEQDRVIELVEAGLKA